METTAYCTFFANTPDSSPELEYGVTPHEMTMTHLFKYLYGYVGPGFDPLVIFDRKLHC